jgi:Family of unknown function (DUF6152)
MRTTMHWLAGVTVVTLLFVALPFAVAHHSVKAIFDDQSTITVKGTVTGVHWVNPHAFLHIGVKNDGKAEDWVVELGSMSNLVRVGWTRERAKVGDPLIITGWRGKAARAPYLGATIDSSGLPRLLRYRDVEFGDGSKLTAGAVANAN